MITDDTITEVLKLFARGAGDKSLIRTLRRSVRFGIALRQLMNDPDATDDEGHITFFGCDIINAFGIGFCAGRDSVWEKIAIMNPKIPLN